MLADSIEKLSTAINDASTPSALDVASQLVTIFGVAIAAFALIATAYQIRESRRESRQAANRHEEQMNALMEQISVDRGAMLNDKKFNDAHLLLTSFAEYDDLFEHSDKAAEFCKENRVLLTKLSSLQERYDPSGFSLLDEYSVHNDDWLHFRKIKTFFKTRYKLRKNKYFSDEALAISMDRYGADLMSNVHKLDVYRFYYAKKRLWDDPDLNKEVLNKSFQRQFADLDWYSELPKFLEEQKAIFGNEGVAIAGQSSRSNA